MTGYRTIARNDGDGIQKVEMQMRWRSRMAPTNMAPKWTYKWQGTWAGRCISGGCISRSNSILQVHEGSSSAANQGIPSDGIKNS